MTMKTLYIDLDEELPDIIRKISEVKVPQLLLIVPQEAFLFQNPVSLKILAQKAKEQKLELLLFTSDESGQKMAQKAGIRLYHGHLKKPKTMALESEKLPQKDPNKRKEKKINITEISEQTRKEISKMPLSVPQKKLQREQHREWTKVFLMSTLRKKTVITLTVLTFAFFWIVFSIAVPSATIYLTPATNVLESTVNIIFADPAKQSQLFRVPGTHALASIPVEVQYEETLLYKTTGKVFTGSSATCIIKVLNQRSSSWALIPKTRFRDRSGVIFRSREQVEVPPARYQVKRNDQGVAFQEKIPGSVLLTVSADEFDEHGNIIGARGNLAGSTPLTLPGLSEFNQTLLSAITEGGCKGGVSEFYSIVTADDLKAGEIKMKEMLEASGRKHLQDRIDAENLKRNSPLTFFDQPEAIQVEILEIEIPQEVENQKLEQIAIKGKAKARGLGYDEQSYLELLEEGLLSKVHPDKVLQSIDPESSTFSIVYSDSELKTLSKIKLSVTVRGLEQYNVDPEFEQGKAVMDRILDQIPGKSTAEASYLMSNLEEIHKAHITIWPFWKNALPTRKSSITIRVE